MTLDYCLSGFGSEVYASGVSVTLYYCVSGFGNEVYVGGVLTTMSAAKQPPVSSQQSQQGYFENFTITIKMNFIIEK